MGGQDASALTNESVLQLVRWHFSDDEIISAIKRNQTHFDLSPSAVAELTAKGAPPSVLAAMKAEVLGTSMAQVAATRAPNDEILFADGAIAGGKILFVQCSPGESAPILPSIEFQSSQVKSKTTLSVSSIRQILLADGAISYPPPLMLGNQFPQRSLPISRIPRECYQQGPAYARARH